jgi:hypothetical protein
MIAYNSRIESGSVELAAHAFGKHEPVFDQLIRDLRVYGSFEFFSLTY